MDYFLICNVWMLVSFSHLCYLMLVEMLLQQEEFDFSLTGGNSQLLTLGLGLLATAVAATYVTRLAKVMPWPAFSFCLTTLP